MMIRTLAAAVLLCAGCVDDGSDSDQMEPTVVEPDKPGDPDEMPTQPTLAEAELALDVCPFVADPDEPDGPCAHACEPEVLATFVPEGYCALFACHDLEGDIQKVGACNL